MSETILTILDDSKWLAAKKRWQCALLKVPGAHIDDLSFNLPPKAKVVFTLALGECLWRSAENGWACPMQRWPGARLVNVSQQAKTLPDSHVSFQDGMILWKATQPPANHKIAVQIEVESDGSAANDLLANVAIEEQIFSGGLLAFQYTLISSSEPIPDNSYSKDDGTIKWTDTTPPKSQSISATIELREKLTTEKESKLHRTLVLIAPMITAIVAALVAFILNDIKDLISDSKIGKVEMEISSGLQPELIKRIKAAKSEIWCAGMNFNHQADVGPVRNALLEALSNGCKVNFLVLDPAKVELIGVMNDAFGFKPSYLDTLKSKF